jgi:hypothetical protein
MKGEGRQKETESDNGKRKVRRFNNIDHMEDGYREGLAYTHTYTVDGLPRALQGLAYTHTYTVDGLPRALQGVVLQGGSTTTHTDVCQQRHTEMYVTDGCHRWMSQVDVTGGCHRCMSTFVPL